MDETLVQTAGLLLRQAHVLEVLGGKLPRPEAGERAWQEELAHLKAGITEMFDEYRRMNRVQLARRFLRNSLDIMMEKMGQILWYGPPLAEADLHPRDWTEDQRAMATRARRTLDDDIRPVARGALRSLDTLLRAAEGGGYTIERNLFGRIYIPG